MITIQITSDPYQRKITYGKITYDRVNGEQLIAIDSSNPDTPEKLKLLSVDYSSCFFPFKAYEIADLIWHTYSTNSTPVCIRFRGTTEEYRELRAVCNILNKENTEQPPESQLPPLTCEQADEYLANAGDIMPKVKNHFTKIKKILDENIRDKDSKKQIEQLREKFDDVSKDEIPICVIGNYSSGKSTFINALIGCEVLPSGDKPLTAKIYEIRCSDNSEQADVEFIANETIFNIKLVRGGYTIRPDDCTDELSVTIRDCLEKGKDKVLVQRVQSLLQIINGGAIDDRVKIHIPFNSDSPLRNSDHPYVLFDTPGDNVANHEHHIQVLQEALRGMSNGLMLYVTVSNQLHTMSNQQLCDKVKAIQEIDTRFTMVIVNQADNADFSEYNRTEVIESPIPVTLQPEGIYYVSSVMALGSKIDGDFVKDNNAMIYMQKQAFFMKKKGERFAQLLFQHNIAPAQIEKAAKDGALHFSEFGDKERVFANSGLWSIEQEIQRFAENYAPYNKCYQSLLFLLKVKEIAEPDISNEVEMHDKSREEFQNQLEAGTKSLLAKLSITRDDLVEQAVNGYPIEMSVTKASAYTPIAKSELVKIETELTAALEEKKKYSERSEIVEKAKENALKVQNIFNAEIREEIAMSYKYWREKVTELNSTREEIDIAAADQLLSRVKDLFNQAVNRAQSVMYYSSSNYWKGKATALRKALLTDVSDSQELSQEKREELQELIEGFEQIYFSIEVEKIFEKELFERRAFFKFFENRRLDKRKLSLRFNSTLKEKIEDNYIEMKRYHKQIFIDWEKRLFSIIEDNITDLNPELREAKKQVAYHQDRVDSFKAARTELNDEIDKIIQLMDWKTIINETSAEE